MPTQDENVSDTEDATGETENDEPFNNKLDEISSDMADTVNDGYNLMEEIGDIDY